MIIADENIPINIVNFLKINNIDAYSIFEKNRGISDKEIIALAQKSSQIILTEDKDFGDLIFAYNQKNVSVILLRYHFSEMENISSILVHFLQNHKIEQHSFIVITSKNIRIRKL